MFLGHFAIALAAKEAAPKVSLGMLVLGAQLADMVWPVFLLLGWERAEILPGITRVTPLDFVRIHGRTAWWRNYFGPRH